MIGCEAIEREKTCNFCNCNAVEFDLQAICGLSLECLCTDVASYNNTQKENHVSKLALNVTKVWITFRIKLCFTCNITISRGNINV